MKNKHVIKENTMGLFDFFKKKDTKKEDNIISSLEKECEIIDKKEAIERELESIPFALGKVSGESGSPQLYLKAYYCWKNFIKYYRINEKYKKEKYYPYNDKDEGWNYVVDSLDILIEIAPRISDYKFMEELIHDVSDMNLHLYPKKKFDDLMDLCKACEELYACVGDDSIKQVDLVKIFDENNNTISVDVKWIIYIWRRFGLVNVEKKGRFNYVASCKNYGSNTMSDLLKHGPSYEVLFAEELHLAKERENSKLI